MLSVPASTHFVCRWVEAQELCHFGAVLVEENLIHRVHSRCELGSAFRDRRGGDWLRLLDEGRFGLRCGGDGTMFVTTILTFCVIPHAGGPGHRARDEYRDLIDRRCPAEGEAATHHARN
jgi:hypothetical protein